MWAIYENWIFGQYNIFPRSQSESALKYKPPLITLANVSKTNLTHPRLQAAVLIKTTATTTRCFDKKPPRECFIASYVSTAILITHSPIAIEYSL